MVAIIFFRLFTVVVTEIKTEPEKRWSITGENSALSSKKEISRKSIESLSN